MKNVIILLFLGLYLYNPSSVKAQQYEDLLVLFVDEKYPKCYDKSIKYTTNDKTKKEPMPYLYAAQALYAMSQDHKYIDEFPKAYIQSLQYATKYRKKDKAYAYRTDAEPFLETLKEGILEQEDNYILTGDEKSYKKALSLMKKVASFDPLCRGSKLLRAELEILTKNKSEGKKMLAIAMKEINMIGEDLQFGDMTLSQQKFLKFSLMFSATLKSKTDMSAAKSIISIGQQYFGEEHENCLIDPEELEDFKELYKSITG